MWKEGLLYDFDGDIRKLSVEKQSFTKPNFVSSAASQLFSPRLKLQEKSLVLHLLSLLSKSAFSK